MYKFIACADLHLRDSVPTCRIDKYWEAQEDKFIFLINKAIEFDCDIYCAGDFFHKAKSSSYLEAWAIKELQRLTTVNLAFWVIPGQHDLPNHNIDLIDHSSLWVLSCANVIDIILNPFEQIAHLNHDIAMVHKMIHLDKPIHKSIKSTKALSLLKDDSITKLIISGDNHIPFITRYKKQILINCGSMMRMSADQIDYKPCFYYIEMDEENIKIERITYPIKANVIDRSYIDAEKERDYRIESFVDRIKNNDYEIELDFNKNLENFFKANRIRKPVQEICWRNLQNE